MRGKKYSLSSGWIVALVIEQTFHPEGEEGWVSIGVQLLLYSVSATSRNPHRRHVWRGWLTTNPMETLRRSDNKLSLNS
jgi:hypothetical protein